MRAPYLNVIIGGFFKSQQTTTGLGGAPVGIGNDHPSY